MNAIPLINNAPRPNINVGSIGSPAFNPVAASAKLGGSIGGNVMRQNPYGNETQLRQEVNTSIVALKREAFSLENLIAQAAQTLQDINKRLSELEGKQGDYVKKNDVVDSITSGNMNPVTSNAVATSNAMPVNSVTSGNMHSVTSNAVSEAIGKMSAYNGDLNSLYPSENGRVEYYYGTFSNAPESRNRAIVKVERVISGQEVQLYQEWIAYSGQTGYIPNKYIRFGYYTTGSVTWSKWQKLIRTSDLMSFIKYKEVKINSITIGSLGYTDIQSYFPSGMNNFMFCLLYDFGTNAGAHSFDINADGIYMRGTSNDTISNVVLRYYYTD